MYSSLLNNHHHELMFVHSSRATNNSPKHNANSEFVYTAQALDGGLYFMSPVCPLQNLPQFSACNLLLSEASEADNGGLQALFPRPPPPGLGTG